MSGGSTNTFEAKKRDVLLQVMREDPELAQKTCGNCNHGFRALVTCWEENPQGRHHAQNEPACPQWSERRPQRMCSCNKSRGYDALLERYEQLEQLTRRMYAYIKNDADESWSPVKEKIARLFQEELEAIGGDCTMTKELEPCPFCGGNASIRTDFTLMSHLHKAIVECEWCDAYKVYYGKTVEEAKRNVSELWNTRYKRTCKSDYCRETDEWQCLSCGGTLQSCAMFDPDVDGFVCSPKFCPNCGAEVVDD